MSEVLDSFSQAVSKAKFIVGQNVSFDVNVWGCEFHRAGKEIDWTSMPVLDTCTENSSTCEIPGGRGGKFATNLTELYSHLFNETFAEAHNATADVEATTRCFLELLRLGHYSVGELQQDEAYILEYQNTNTDTIQTLGLKHLNLKEESQKYKKETTTSYVSSASEDLSDEPFAHLHNHSQFPYFNQQLKLMNW